MKRRGNLYLNVCSIDNLELADQKARKGKGSQKGIINHDKNRLPNILDLHYSLINKTFTTSKYKQFMVNDNGKEREIFSLPYRDRIVHHAVSNYIEPIFTSTFTADTYSCIKGRGTLKASLTLRKALRDLENTKYCLKLDIKKFYPSVDHDVLKNQLRRKIKDQDLLWLLDNIIDSGPGVPIGNLLSQHFANFYLSPFDHWIKGSTGGAAVNYFRYCDDLVILSSNKFYLHQLLNKIKVYLETNLKLTLKSNWQIFPVAARGIDFVGYVHYHTHVRLRKRIKKRFARMLNTQRKDQSIAAYKGWLKYGNCRNLERKLLETNN